MKMRCDRCGRPFTTSNHRQRFCSIECQRGRPVRPFDGGQPLRPATFDKPARTEETDPLYQRLPPRYRGANPLFRYADDDKPGECQWLGDNGRFCDQPVYRGSYCRRHAAVVYRPDYGPDDDNPGDATEAVSVDADFDRGPMTW